MEPEDEFERLRDRGNWAVRGLAERPLPRASRRSVVLRSALTVVSAAAVAALVIGGVTTLRSDRIEVEPAPAAPSAFDFDQFTGLPSGVMFDDHYSSDPWVYAWRSDGDVLVSLWGGVCPVPVISLAEPDGGVLDLEFGDAGGIECPASLGYTTTVVPAEGVDEVRVTHLDETATASVGDLPATDACSVDDLSAAVESVGRSGDMPSVRVQVANRSDVACRVSELRAAHRVTADGEELNPESPLTRMGVDTATSILLEPGDHATVTIAFDAGESSDCEPVESVWLDMRLEGQVGSIGVEFARAGCANEQLRAQPFWQRIDPRG